jgi:hypothetical protein
MEYPDNFHYTTDGYQKAREYLKTIGEFELIATAGLSTDGYSLVHEANSIWRKEQYKNNNHMSEKSIGEQRVRTEFNVAEGAIKDFVTDVKHRTAELINICEAFKPKDPRLAAMAQTAYEEAAMWAVKAATA